MKGVLRVLIDEFSQQQETLDQLLVRMTSLEDTSNKQQLLLNTLKSAILIPTNNVNRPKNNVVRRKTAQARKIVHQASRHRSTKIAAYKAFKFHSGHQKSHKDHKHNGTEMTRHGKKRVERPNKDPKLLKQATPVLSRECPLYSGGSKDARSADHLSTKPRVRRNQETGSHLLAHPRNEPLSCDQSTLHAIDNILCKYRNFALNGRVVSLARMLAQAVIGEDELKKCTPHGHSHYPPLPVDSLKTIKQALFNYFPELWDRPEDFEEDWAKCVLGIMRLCCTLRLGTRSVVPSPSSAQTVESVINSIVLAPDLIKQPPSPAQETSTILKSETESSPPAPVMNSAEQISTNSEPADMTSGSLAGKHLPYISSAGIGKGPKVRAISGVKTPLPSFEIAKSELFSVDEFMAHHSAAISDQKFTLGSLAVKLASDVIFGKKVLMKCSPSGCRGGLYGLPVAEFNRLKQLVLDCCPSLWDNMPEFERQWKVVCRTQLSYRCANLRWQAKTKCINN